MVSVLHNKIEGNIGKNSIADDAETKLEGENNQVEIEQIEFPFVEPRAPKENTQNEQTKNMEDDKTVKSET